MAKATKARKAPVKKTESKKAVKAVKLSKTAKVSKKVPASPKTTAGKSEIAAAAPSEEKLEVISQYQVKEGDTGSPEVQVALLTKRIDKLVLHLKTNPADNHSRRGLLGIVSKRRRLLNYLMKKDSKRYRAIAQKLELGK